MPPAPRAPFRPDLEGLRGLAVLLAVLYHAGVPGFGGGFVGVDVLFVLSGYFATRLLAREYAATGAVDVAAFYGRRALRLLPALLVVLAATLALAWACYAPIDRAAVADAARAAALGRSNHAFARDAVNYFSRHDSPLLHTWSLAVELQVSLVWPPLFALLAGVGAWRRGGRPDDPVGRRADGLLRGVGAGLVGIGAASFAAALWLTHASPSWAFFSTGTRAWEFALGGLLALTLAEPGSQAAAGPAGRWPRWLHGAGLVALAGAALAYGRATPYPGLAALAPALGAAALVAGGRAAGAPGFGGRLLAAPALRWLGGVSYGWYLWHWPLIVTGGVLDPAIGAAGRVAWSVVALGLAWLTLRAVERPARALGAARAPGPWLAAGAAGACLAAAFAAGALRGAAARRAARPDQRAFAAAREDAMPRRCWATTAAAALADTAPPCVFGDPGAATTVVLLGDSHAAHWLAALDRLGRERGWRVVAMVKGGCPVADAPELIPRYGARRGRECARYREATVRRIVAMRPAAAVLSSYTDYVAGGPGGDAGRVSPGAWRRGLRRTYARLTAAGVPVVALRGTPQPGFDAPACLSRRAAGAAFARPCAYGRVASLHHPAAAAQDAAARGLRVRVVDMNDRVCAAARCGVVRRGVVVFADDNHLTAGFARAAAPALGARMDAALGALGARLP